MAKLTAVMHPRQEDILRDIRTYKLSDGRFLELDKRTIALYGVDTLLAEHGAELYRQSGRLPVVQRGKVVGSLPAAFDPDAIQSRTFLYDPRPGDFRLENNQWVVTPMLGPGDLDAVPGFSRELA